MSTTPPKKSDLGVRTLSAIVMLALAGGALWAGGWVWAAFVALVSAGVLWEWVKLARAITPKLWARAAWFVGGVVYVGLAGEVLNHLRHDSALPALALVLAVVATDVGAYFAGRAFGGPKIAPRISPSKTWAGLVGAIIATTLVLIAFDAYGNSDWLVVTGGIGALIAIIAQAGDFFESWMKRRAGVKDSGHLIPGHGGLFDRLDGLLAVCFVIGVFGLVSRL